MRPLKHITASAILGMIFLIFVRPFWAVLIVFLAGVFIDLDHLIDFWALKPRRPFNVRDFLNSESRNEQTKWIFVFLHSWELVTGLWLWAFLAHWPLWQTSMAAGITLHLILDIANVRHYKMRPFAYFLVFRAIKGFKKSKICYENNR